MSFQFNLKLCVCSGALLAATNATAQLAIPLPGIVIEGATLEKSPVTKSRSTQADDVGDQPSPSAKPAGQNAQQAKAKPVSTGQAIPPPSASEATAAQPYAGMPASQIGSAVTVVTAGDIQSQQARTSADVLRALPGVTVSSSGTPGSFTQVRIRGSDGRDTRVLIDGVEANTTKDAEFDFSNLSPEDIERIEVIRGPMSALYGSGALGGVINIETKAAKGPLSSGAPQRSRVVRNAGSGGAAVGRQRQRLLFADGTGPQLERIRGRTGRVDQRRYAFADFRSARRT